MWLLHLNLSHGNAGASFSVEAKDTLKIECANLILQTHKTVCICRLVDVVWCYFIIDNEPKIV